MVNDPVLKNILFNHEKNGLIPCAEKAIIDSLEGTYKGFRTIFLDKESLYYLNKRIEEKG